jgi:hypothetical protein
LTEVEIDANDLLMSAGVPSAKFKSIGDSVSGVIVKPPVVQQMRDYETNEPLFYEDGNPKRQIVITLQTEDCEDDDDDGVRNLYCKAQMQTAIRVALRKAKVRKLEVGGTLTVTFSSEIPNANKKMKPTKQFKASYIPPETDPHAEPADVEV